MKICNHCFHPQERPVEDEEGGGDEEGGEKEDN
jgi:hypothetical protein